MTNFSLFLMGNPNDPNAGIINLVFLGAIFFVFYFFIIRPQSQRQKEIQRKVEAMKKGDKVVTSSGIIGILNAIEDDSVLIEVGGSVKIRFLKTAITDVNPNKPEKKDK
ncbi:MAG: preprotein translocase subunit YajC [Balneolales bacterium]|nr:preprotein translocase subunit YajC [Balneolales bacterium]